MSAVPATKVSYPGAIRLDLVEHRHGQSIPDPYRWLEDSGDPRTVSWLGEQGELFAAERGRWRDLAGWRAELAALTAVDRVLTPKARGNRIFLRQQRAGQDYPVLFVRTDGCERTLLDPLALDPTGRTVLETWEPSIEGDLLAYQLSCDGTEDSLLRVLDVAGGRIVDGPINRVRSTPIGWLPGGGAFYYVRRLPPGLHPGEERYHRRVYLHQLGSDPDTDVLVFGEGRDKAQFYDIAVTADGRWLTITATAGAAPGTELYLADLFSSSPGRPGFRAVQEAGDGPLARTRLHIEPETGPREAAWLRTDSAAARGRVVTCVPGSPAPGSWREFIPERPDAVLLDLAVLAGAGLPRPVMLVSWARHATAEVTVHDLADGHELGKIPLPGLGSIGRFSVPPGGGHEAWFCYSDHRTPPVLLHYDGLTGQVATLSRPEADADGVAVCLTEFQSHDGTTIRMFVLSPAGRPDRPRPAILTGYGGFGVSMSPGYSPDALAWARAGGVFAIACLRGGGEEGAQWHRGGRGENKQNTFDDFAAAAGHLTAAGWTRPDRLAIMGGSNGGLLAAAALTQHPEMYAAAVCMAPLLDMARYELSGLGPSWVPEYGSAADPGQLRTLLSYSPYHHVTLGASYPPVLFTVSDGDTRVDPLHARKMCAALQHASSGLGPVLLRHERGVGHGARALSRELALLADCLAFLACHVGLPAPGGEP
jgi:prolyl oligopeptidase